MLRLAPPFPLRLAGWTLSSISGFSSAFARAVDSAVAIRQQRRAHVQPANVGRGLVQGLTGLAEGVAAGLSAVVEAPIQVGSKPCRPAGLTVWSVCPGRRMQDYIM